MPVAGKGADRVSASAAAASNVALPDGTMLFDISSPDGPMTM
jgi:hypothetical protein